MLLLGIWQFLAKSIEVNLKEFNMSDFEKPKVEQDHLSFTRIGVA